jgi:GxxExxY protein
MEPQMNADEHRLKLDQITEKIIGCAYTVANTLGCGFLEKVYENALAHEIRKAGFEVKQQYGIKVLYDNIIVGEYVSDLLVNDCVMVELKAVTQLDNIHTAQSLNYLKATGLHMCLLINFGKPKIDVKRLVNQF